MLSLDMIDLPRIPRALRRARSARRTMSKRTRACSPQKAGWRLLRSRLPGRPYLLLRCMPERRMLGAQMIHPLARNMLDRCPDHDDL